ncbi:hypothetical protein L1049_021214 [Liquidambar formosana]|uniref:Uncharacterized protein n=1 Tax=Liquidambar formosana TaxID=63359 RepID=A0AAP0SEY8_LIQFO
MQSRCDSATSLGVMVLRESPLSLDKDGDAIGDDIESLHGKAHSGGMFSLKLNLELDASPRWSIVTLSLTILTSSQAILIVWSKRAGKYEYSVTTANFMVEALKCALSLATLGRIWRNEGVIEDNKLSTTFDEVSVYPIPAALYLVKNLLQYYIFAYVDAPGYQILKNLNIISTCLLYRIILKKNNSNLPSILYGPHQAASVTFFREQSLNFPFGSRCFL